MKKPENESKSNEYNQYLSQTFIQRWDQYPKQLNDGSYVLVREPLTDHLLIEHLHGNITLGAYVLDQDSCGRYIVFDADDDPEWRQLRALSTVLGQMECPSYLERSRRGGHLWLFFLEKTKAKDIRLFGSALMEYFGIGRIELFPKQDELTTGPGSLIRLPFGVHRKSGRRYSFYTSDGEHLAPTIREQLKILSNPETVPVDIFEQYHYQGVELSEMRQNSHPIPQISRSAKNETDGLQLSDRIKAAIPVRQFVLSFVELTPGGKGLCPFHDDRVESFSVNDPGNYWHCFGCDTGGSIIDFYMRWEECDFKTAVRELANELL